MLFIKASIFSSGFDNSIIVMSEFVWPLQEMISFVHANWQLIIKLGQRMDQTYKITKNSDYTIILIAWKLFANFVFLVTLSFLLPDCGCIWSNSVTWHRNTSCVDYVSEIPLTTVLSQVIITETKDLLTVRERLVRGYWFQSKFFRWRGSRWGSSVVGTVVMITTTCDASMRKEELRTYQTFLKLSVCLLLE